jgi:hypothetical protein
MVRAFGSENPVMRCSVRAIASEISSAAALKRESAPFAVKGSQGPRDSGAIFMAECAYVRLRTGHVCAAVAHEGREDTVTGYGAWRFGLSPPILPQAGSGAPSANLPAMPHGGRNLPLISSTCRFC